METALRPNRIAPASQLHCDGTVIVHRDLSTECTDHFDCDVERLAHEFSTECDDPTCCAA